MVYAVVSPEIIQLPAGAVVRLPATWQEYQILCQLRGGKSIPRLKFQSGEVLLMSPLPQHGRDASLIADIIKVLLDHHDQEYDSFTPITMQIPEERGIEPDYCFYIDHWSAVSGKDRIDWTIDPPPDLVLEIDVTSYSDAQDYLPYQIPEIWVFRDQQLTIYGLQEGGYSVRSQSRYFPDVDLAEVIGRCLRMAYERNTSAAIRELRSRL